jgi:hypothetical protein
MTERYGDVGDNLLLYRIVYEILLYQLVWSGSSNNVVYKAPLERKCVEYVSQGTGHN